MILKPCKVRKSWWKAVCDDPWVACGRAEFKYATIGSEQPYYHRYALFKLMACCLYKSSGSMAACRREPCQSTIALPRERLWGCADPSPTLRGPYTVSQHVYPVNIKR